jgi:hypothetical protein
MNETECNMIEWSENGFECPAVTKKWLDSLLRDIL